MVKLMVMGYARHGKDTVAGILREDFNFRCVSSSEWAAEYIVWPRLQELGELVGGLPSYGTWQECYVDRANHRQFWYETIKSYNEPDPALMGRQIYSGASVYVGVRHSREFHALRNSGEFNFALWVDRGEHVEPEGRASCTVEPWMADFVLDNNGSIDDLRRNVRVLMARIRVIHNRRNLL